jgi:hypothetical protein
MTFSAVVLALSICSRTTAGAICSCIERPPITTERDAAAVAKQFGLILDGTATSVERDTTRFEVRATIAVQQRWGRTTSDTIVVSTSIGGGDCGFEFKPGERYLVFARETARSWYTGICTPSRAWDAEAARVAGLLGPPAPAR